MMDDGEFRAKLLASVEAGVGVLEIRPLLVEQLERGVKRDDLYQELLDTIHSLRAEGREADEDAVADVADLFSEWVPAEYRL
ncbi:hypothetical protein ACGFMK_32500 [Amycolatopsis sp. NPDC049252]|uniref:hypothetical protein n=1 Tax=Amycolatopsis sp. NPDC049252 TaxID=3363933 RepID=UPI0037208FFC